MGAKLVYIHALTCTLILLFSISSCSGYHHASLATNNAIMQHPGAALDSLPSPAAALARMAKAAGDPVYWRFGREFDAALRQRAAVEGDCVRFSPDWTGNASGYYGLAYGMYRFNLTDYSGTASFSLDWVNAPENLNNVWLGLSEWEHGQWKWFNCPAGSVFELPTPPGLAPYTKPGTSELLAVVLMVGQSPGLLHMCGLQFSEPVDYWPVLGHDAKHTGRSLNLGPTTNALKWKFKTNEPSDVLSSPLVTTDGSAYLYGSNKNVLALNPDGTVRWQKQFKKVTGLACSASGIVYVGVWENSASSLAAFDAQGAPLWTFNPEVDDYIRGPAIGPDGAIYFYAGYLFVLNPDGTQRSKFDDGTSYASPVVLGPDGAVYIKRSLNLAKFDPSGSIQWQVGNLNYGFNDEYLPLAVDASGIVYTFFDGGMFTALNSDGTVRWTSTVYQNIDSRPAIGEDGTVYVGGYQDAAKTQPAFFAINPDGTVKWQISAAAAVDSPLIDAEGTVLFTDDHLRAVTQDGVEQWACPLKDRGDGLIATDAAGRLYVIGTYITSKSLSQLYAINPGGTTAWTFGSGSLIQQPAAPVIGEDETIYFSSFGGAIYALNPDGTQKWRYDAGEIFDCSPTVTPDNNVYAVDTSAGVHALDSTGAVRWIHSSEYEALGVLTPPVIGPDGTVYYSDCGEHQPSGSPLGQFHVLHPDGTLKWSHIFEESMQMAATLREDGSTIVSSIAGDVHCFDPDGAVLWENPLPAPSFCLSYPLAPDNSIYFAAQDGLKAFNGDGTVKWSVGAIANSLGSPAITAGGTVYYINLEDIYASNYRISAVSSTGYELWTSSTDIPDLLAAPSISIDGAGCIYCGSSIGIIYQLSPSGALLQTFDTGSGTYTTPVAIGPHNTIYVGCYDGCLYAFGD